MNLFHQVMSERRNWSIKLRIHSSDWNETLKLVAKHRNHLQGRIKHHFKLQCAISDAISINRNGLQEYPYIFANFIHRTLTTLTYLLTCQWHLLVNCKRMLVHSVWTGPAVLSCEFHWSSTAVQNAKSANILASKGREN